MLFEKILPAFREGAKIKKDYWDENSYIFCKNEDFFDEKGERVRLSTEALLYSGWEFYQEKIDWDYIIKNKCLCWFWDDVDSLEESSYGYLTYHNKNILYCYNGKKWYKNCRPVRKDEVTFYEDVKK